MQVLNFSIRKQIQHMEVDLYPSVLIIENAVYLVDCGYEETYDEFVEELNRLGIHKIDGIIISHDDIDHLGALSKFKEADPSTRIYCSDIERHSIEGITRSERLVQTENSLPFLPKESIPWANEFIAQLENINRIPVDETFRDEEWIREYVQVIHTPGHTSGHISLYIPSQETIIANDALVIEDGSFNIANPQFCLDLPMAIRSVEKIKNLHPKKIICYHGGIMEDKVDNKLRELLNKFRN